MKKELFIVLFAVPFFALHLIFKLVKFLIINWYEHIDNMREAADATK